MESNIVMVRGRLLINQYKTFQTQFWVRVMILENIENKKLFDSPIKKIQTSSEAELEN